MELYVLNEFDSAHDFAMEMQKQMEEYFVFLLKPSRKEFLHTPHPPSSLQTSFQSSGQNILDQVALLVVVPTMMLLSTA